VRGLPFQVEQRAGEGATAMLFLSAVGTQRRPGAGHVLNRHGTRLPGLEAIADTGGTAIRVEGRVLLAHVQIRVVVDDPHGNGAQLFIDQVVGIARHLLVGGMLGPLAVFAPGNGC
jgi:hypothetical protein